MNISSHTTPNRVETELQRLCGKGETVARARGIFLAVVTKRGAFEGPAFSDSDRLALPILCGYIAAKELDNGDVSRSSAVRASRLGPAFDDAVKILREAIRAVPYSALVASCKLPLGRTLVKWMNEAEHLVLSARHHKNKNAPALTGVKAAVEGEPECTESELRDRALQCAVFHWVAADICKLTVDLTRLLKHNFVARVEYEQATKEIKELGFSAGPRFRTLVFDEFNRMIDMEQMLSIPASLQNPTENAVGPQSPVKREEDAVEPEGRSEQYGPWLPTPLTPTHGDVNAKSRAGLLRWERLRIHGQVMLPGLDIAPLPVPQGAVVIRRKAAGRPLKMSRGMRAVCRILWDHGMDQQTILKHCALLIPTAKFGTYSVRSAIQNGSLPVDDVENDYDYVTEETRRQYPPLPNSIAQTGMRTEPNDGGIPDDAGDIDEIENEDVDRNTNYTLPVTSSSGSSKEKRSARSSAAKLRYERRRETQLNTATLPPTPSTTIANTAAALKIEKGRKMSRGIRALCRILDSHNISQKAIVAHCNFLVPGAGITPCNVSLAVQNKYRHPDDVARDYEHVSVETRLRYPPPGTSALLGESSSLVPGEGSAQANLAEGSESSVSVRALCEPRTEETQNLRLDADDRLGDSSSSSPVHRKRRATDTWPEEGNIRESNPRKRPRLSSASSNESGSSRATPMQSSERLLDGADHGAYEPSSPLDALLVGHSTTLAGVADALAVTGVTSVDELYGLASLDGVDRDSILDPLVQRDEVTDSQRHTLMGLLRSLREVTSWSVANPSRAGWSSLSWLQRVWDTIRAM